MNTDELILRFLLQETTEMEEQALDSWRAEALENEARFRQIVKLWDLRRLLEPTLHLDAAPSAADILRGTLPEHTRPAPTPTPDEVSVESPAADSTREPSWFRRRLSFSSAGAKVAAIMLFLLIGAGSLGYFGAQSRVAASSVELVTVAGELSTARLADGSVVRLAPQSRLQFEMTKTSRRVWLHGRAFFVVEHDPARPFTVETHAGEVMVLGTRFDLEARSGELQLIVVAGKVGLSAGGESVQVLAGQRSRASGGRQPEVEDLDDLYGSLDWIGNFVAFESTPLRDVIRELEQRYGLRIQIHDSVLAAQTVTSWSTDRSPQEVLAAVCLALNAFCTVTDSLITIER